jgi:hypothetical protein
MDFIELFACGRRYFARRLMSMDMRARLRLYMICTFPGGLGPVEFFRSISWRLQRRGCLHSGISQEKFSEKVPYNYVMILLEKSVPVALHDSYKPSHSSTP